MNKYQSTTPESLFTPELTQWIKDSIPLLNNMEVNFDQFYNGELTVSCPLAPNINDKGTAFGGSIAALATICGWLYTTLYARTVVKNCAVVIADSQLTYHAPGTGNISAKCQTKVPGSFYERLNDQRNAKLVLEAELFSQCSQSNQNTHIASYTGIYIAMPVQK